MNKNNAICIENNEQCFIDLWRRLEQTRQLLRMQYKRFCIRRILILWLGAAATDVFIWDVCNRTIIDDEPALGLNTLPPPSLHPRPSREFLRALVSVKLGIGINSVNLQALDRAYSIAFPHSTPINVSKKNNSHTSVLY